MARNRPRIKPFTNGGRRVRLFVVYSRMVFRCGEGQCAAGVAVREWGGVVRVDGEYSG